MSRASSDGAQVGRDGRPARRCALDGRRALVVAAVLSTSLGIAACRTCQAVNRVQVVGTTLLVDVQVGQDTQGFVVKARQNFGTWRVLLPRSTGPIMKGGLVTLEIDIAGLPAGTYAFQVWGCGALPLVATAAETCVLGPPARGTFRK